MIVRANNRGQFGRGLVRALIVAAASTALGGRALAQPENPGGTPTSPELAAFEGRPVHEVVLVSVPRRAGEEPLPLSAETERLIRNNLRLSAGAPFTSATVRDDIARLTRLGQFRSVESRVRLMSDGSVEVGYLLVQQPVIQAVQTVGNREFSDEELGAEVSAFEGTPMDPTQLERACRRIEARYREKGYYNTLVTVDEAELEKNQIAVFRVREGSKTKVTQIRFEGLRSYPAGQVKGVLKTKEAFLLFERGPVDNETLDEDIGNIIKFFKDRGHLDVRVDRTVLPSPDGREAIVTFVIEEGPQYTLRDLHVETAPDETPAFTAAQLEGLLAIKAGDLYNLDRLQRSIRALEQAYGALGYVDARIEKRELREPDQPVVDVLLSIRQGRAFRTGVINVTGNAKTREDVIRERLTIRPDRPLDTGEIEESKKRLNDSRLFAAGRTKITVQPEKEEDPGYRDLLVEVTETNTGAFNFGAGLSADSGVLGSFSITQRNFDITDMPDSWGELINGEAFHGAGQTFTIMAQPGSRVRNFSIGLSDPYAFGTDYSAGASLYYRDRLYRAYTETRTGLELRAGRRFGSRWTLSVPLRIEHIRLSSIDDDAPTEFFDEADGQTLYSLGATLTRQSYDNVATPSKGSKIEASLEQFGGDANFTHLRAEYARIFRLHENVLGEKTVFTLSSKLGYIPQDSESVPFYDRLYLGGQSFRGFDYRGVAPPGIRHDTGGISRDTVGGTFSFFLGGEIRQPLLTDLVSGVVFIDTGTVDTDIAFDKYRVSVGVGLRIYVEQVSPVPFAFDFGFPILKEETDRERLFTFSIDLPFN